MLPPHRACVTEARTLLVICAVELVSYGKSRRNIFSTPYGRKHFYILFCITIWIDVCFRALMSQANVWLKRNCSIEILKCETVQKKIASAEGLGDCDPKFDEPLDDTNIYSVQGLR